jgi:hypothetical protein
MIDNQELNAMSGFFEFEPSKTYVTEDNAKKAFEKRFPEVRYFVMPSKDGRFFPVAVGQAAIQAGVHFHFNVVA